jgi:ubiquinone/menaquinone biosynthesis C-methylase UbiE
MSSITWTHPFVYELLETIPNNTNTLVDVGCGRGLVGALMRIYRRPSRLVAMDAFDLSLAFCRKHDLYDEYTKVDITSLPLPFCDKEFDVATCIEVIEHVPKQVGLKLLCELERISYKVIVTTPTDFFRQECFDENPFQQHLSQWTIRDFTSRDFTASIFECFGRFRIYPNYNAFVIKDILRIVARTLGGTRSTIIAHKTSNR